MFPEHFTTERLLLRPVTLADAPAIFHGYAQDPEVSRFLLWRPHRSIEDTQAYLASCAASTYAITDRTGGALIGAFDLRQHEPWRLGFGYVLARPFWSRGLMTGALTAIADWALRQPGIWRIGDYVDVENAASARVMEKSGLQREGLLRRWGVHPNLGAEPRDCYVYGKVRPGA
ncbi:MAG: GNAT family N-acetyltransferase [Acetobacteraceae bacterium]